MNLLHLLDQSLIGRSDDPALEWQRRIFTFGELDARSNRVAHALQQRGFAKGDRLCVYLPNRNVLRGADRARTRDLRRDRPAVNRLPERARRTEAISVPRGSERTRITEDTF